MTGPAPTVQAGHHGRDDLTVRIFRGLYTEFDLHTVDGTHIAVPKGTPCFAAPTLGEIAQQISQHEHPDPPHPRPAPPHDHT